MNTQLKMLHGRPRLLAGLAAIVLGTAAMAAVVAWTPAASELPVEEFAPEPIPAGKAKCAECGVIISRREIEEPRDEAAPKSSLNSSRRYEITVRMGDGSSCVIDDVRPANWRAGERVTLIDGVERPMR